MKKTFAVCLIAIFLISSTISVNDIFADRDDDKHEKYKEKKKKKTLEEFCEKKKRIHFRAIVCDAYFELQNAIKELYEITNENVEAISKLEKKVSLINNEDISKTGKLVYSPYGISPSQLGFVYADDTGVYLSPSEKGFISIDGLPHGAKITSLTCNSENGFVTAELTCELFRRNISDMGIEVLSTNIVSVDSNSNGIVGTINTAINFDSIDTENYSYNLSFVSNASLDMPIRDVIIEFTS